MISEQFIHLNWPWLLLALFALLLPVWIHWFSQQKPKTLSFALLNLLPDVQPVAKRHIQLQEAWLFILRCLLIVVSVLLLAGLYFEHQNDKQTSIRSINLISTDYLTQVPVSQVQQLAQDSKNGDKSAFLLSPGYPRVSSEAFQQIIEAKQQNRGDIWLQQFSKMDRVRHLQPNQWAGIVNFVEYFDAMYPQSDGRVSINLYVSRELQHFQFQMQPADIGPELHWHFNERAENQGSTEHNELSKSFSVLIVADPSRQAQAEKLQMALMRIDQAKLAKLDIQLIADSQFTKMLSPENKEPVNPLTGATGVFYLPGDESVSQDKVATQLKVILKAMPDGSFLFSEQALSDNPIALNNRQISLDLQQQQNSFAGMLLEPVSVYKTLAPTNSALFRTDTDMRQIWVQDIWQKAAQPILRKSLVQLLHQQDEEYRQMRGVNFWQLNTRLHPQWSNVMEQRQFAHLLYVWLFSEQIESDFNQNYLLPESWFGNPALFMQNQAVAPTQENDSRVSLARANQLAQTQLLNESQKQRFSDWQKVFAWLLCLIFIIERVYSEWSLRQRKTIREDVDAAP